MPPPFQPGIATLLNTHAAWLRGRRVALVSHPAAVDTDGTHSLERLAQSGLTKSLVVWGPEHGFLGTAGAGEHVRHARHPLWNIPVYSLYGTQRQPTPRMLREIDTIVVDLQDLAVRCYTYVSTLRYILEAAAAHGKTVIVADRPVPFPTTVDGPMLTPACTSFVGAIPAPLVYGMTPAETARWLQCTLALDLDLRIAAMRGYSRDEHRSPDWPPWIPPSPGIATWDSARCYPATVMTEALPTLDCARTSRLPFQSLVAPWIDAHAFCDALRATKLPGITFHPHATAIRTPLGATRPAQGVRLVITNPARYRPVLTAITLLHTLQKLYGQKRLWTRASRPDFFDKLFGTPATRESLHANATPATIAATWHQNSTPFRRTREKYLLYPNT